MDTIKTGALIAGGRREKGLTQKDLAQALHVSVQAVSKWERGLNFPDVALLEPLAGLLDLTVSELLAGERGTPPREAVVLESLRMGLTQMRNKVRKWRALFGAVLALLLVLALVGGYGFVRNCTELLPQRVTVAAPRDSTEREQLVARTAGNSSVYLFDLTLADGLEELSVQLELWTEEGLAQTWSLAQYSGGLGEYPRRQILAFSGDISFWEEQPVLKYGVAISGFASWNGTLDDVPYLSGGYVLGILKDPVTVSPEHGAVLACFSLSPTGSAIWRAPGWTGDLEAPVVEEGEAYLLLRLYAQ